MEELKDLREKIDAIDQQMVDLFKQRMEVSKEVAAYKQANGANSPISVRYRMAAWQSASQPTE